MNTTTNSLWGRVGIALIPSLVLLCVSAGPFHRSDALPEELEWPSFVWLVVGWGFVLHDRRALWPALLYPALFPLLLLLEGGYSTAEYLISVPFIGILHGIPTALMVGAGWGVSNLLRHLASRWKRTPFWTAALLNRRLGLAAIWVLSAVPVLAIVGVTAGQEIDPKEARRFQGYELYWLGRSYQGVPLTRVDPGDFDELENDGWLALSYGDCEEDGRIFEIDDGACYPPLDVFVHSNCTKSARTFLSIDDVVVIRGAPVVVTGGTAKVYTGRTVVALHPNGLNSIAAVRRLRPAGLGPEAASGPLPPPTLPKTLMDRLDRLAERHAGRRGLSRSLRARLRFRAMVRRLAGPTSHTRACGAEERKAAFPFG